MERATLYLRTAMFSLGRDGHVPPGVMVLDAIIEDRPKGGMIVRTQAMYDSQGRLLSDALVRLHLPWSKIDHMHLPLED